MPAYDYTCDECGAHFAVRASIAAYTAGLDPVCTACGSTQVTRCLGRVSVVTGSRSASGSASRCGPGGFT